MTILIVGYSNIAQRKVIPALLSLSSNGNNDFNRINIEIATSRPNKINTDLFNRPVRVFKGYEEGIRQSKAEICYISTVNGAHFEHALTALSSGKHTIVDKPISMMRSDADKLLEYSRKQRLLLSESVVYLDHVRAAELPERLRQSAHVPRHINALFCFPPLPQDNFRYNPEIGGGALMDLGAYMVSPGRHFFREKPISAHALITESQKDLPTGLRVNLVYSGGRSFSGYYSFEAEYQNQIHVIGKDFTLQMERFFTTPADRETQVEFRTNNSSEIWTYPPCDTFAEYLSRILALTGRGEPEEFEGERMKINDDQALLALLRQSIQQR